MYLIHILQDDGLRTQAKSQGAHLYIAHKVTDTSHLLDAVEPAYSCHCLKLFRAHNISRNHFQPLEPLINKRYA